MNLWKACVEALWDIVEFSAMLLFPRPEEVKLNPVINPPEPIQPPIVIAPPVETPKYLWGTPTLARHSVRVIADEEGLDVEQKNTMCATIGAESGWIITAVHKNIVNGKVTSVDYGICQWNNVYHGKEISPTEALEDPEKAVRLMCSYWKRGQRDLWMAYKNGSFKRYL